MCATISKTKANVGEEANVPLTISRRHSPSVSAGAEAIVLAVKDVDSRIIMVPDRTCFSTKGNRNRFPLPLTTADITEGIMLRP